MVVSDCHHGHPSEWGIDDDDPDEESTIHGSFLYRTIHGYWRVVDEYEDMFVETLLTEASRYEIGEPKVRRPYELPHTTAATSDLIGANSVEGLILAEFLQVTGNRPHLSPPSPSVSSSSCSRSSYRRRFMKQALC